jgi:hypothetical protein
MIKTFYIEYMRNKTFTKSTELTLMCFIFVVFQKVEQKRNDY